MRATARRATAEQHKRLATTRAAALRAATGYTWQPEHQFCQGRKWAFDFACLSIAVAIEIEGGVWTHGRHSRGTGMIADMEKYNTAQIFGWIVLRYTPEQFAAGAWIPDVEAAARRTRSGDVA